MKNNLLKEISDNVSLTKMGQQGIADMALKKRNDTEVSGLHREDNAYRVTKSIKSFCNSNFYGKDGKNIYDDVKTFSDKDEKTRFSGLILSAMTSSKKDFSKMIEDGYSPMDMEEGDYVTVVEKIKVSLLKAGVDISMMGGIKDSAIESISDSKIDELNLKSNIKSHLEENNIIYDDDTIKSIAETYRKAYEISTSVKEGITENAAKYLIKNELNPTINNVYTAVFSGLKSENTSLTAAIDSEKVQDNLIKSFEKVIEKSDSYNNKKNDIEESIYFSKEDNIVENKDLKEAQWLYDNDLLVNKDNLNKIKDLYSVKIPSKKELEKNIDCVILMGLNPSDISLVKDKSIFSNALAILDAKLVMTKEAALVSAKLGITVDNADIIDKAELLRKINNEGFDNKEDKDLYNKTVDIVNSLKNMPLETIGAFDLVRSVNIDRLFNKGHEIYKDITSKNDIFIRLENTYEGVGTEVRKDLGDSIKKAFRNIDSLLRNMDLTVTEENRRAVKILGYNNLDITKENIDKIKTEDLMVNRVFDLLKPGIVMDLIKKNKNPLDLKLGELLDEIEKINEERIDTDSSDSMAEFLWKAEKNNAISDEEREAYIGIYRLIHKINKDENRAIGSLLDSNVSITLRNLLKASRTDKKKGTTYTVDDENGYTTVKNTGKNIINQIEIGFYSETLKNIENISDPSKFKKIEDKLNQKENKNKGEHILSMKVEELHTLLRKEESNKSIDDEWIETKRNEFIDNVRNISNKTTDIIENLNINPTLLNVSLVNNMIENGRGIFKDLFTKKTYEDYEVRYTEDTNIRKLVEKEISKFGENIKNRDDYKKVEERIYDIAENAMKGVLTSKDSSYIDIKRIKNVNKQLSFYNKLTKDDIYNMPIKISGEDGVMTLKFVNGKGHNGTVDIFMDFMDRDIYTKITSNTDKMKFNITLNDRKSYEIFRQNEHKILSDMNKVSDKEIELKISMSDLSVEDFFVNNILKNKEDITKRKNNRLDENNLDNINDIDNQKLYEITSKYIHCIRNL